MELQNYFGLQSQRKEEDPFRNISYRHIFSSQKIITSLVPGQNNFDIREEEKEHEDSFHDRKNVVNSEKSNYQSLFFQYPINMNANHTRPLNEKNCQIIETSFYDDQEAEEQFKFYIVESKSSVENALNKNKNESDYSLLSSYLPLSQKLDWALFNQLHRVLHTASSSATYALCKNFDLMRLIMQFKNVFFLGQPEIFDSLRLIAMRPIEDIDSVMNINHIDIALTTALQDMRDSRDVSVSAALQMPYATSLRRALKEGIDLAVIAKSITIQFTFPWPINQLFEGCVMKSFNEIVRFLLNLIMIKWNSEAYWKVFSTARSATFYDIEKMNGTSKAKDISRLKRSCRIGLSVLLRAISGLCKYYIGEIHTRFWREFHIDIVKNIYSILTIKKSLLLMLDKIQGMINSLHTRISEFSTVALTALAALQTAIEMEKKAQEGKYLDEQNLNNIHEAYSVTASKFVLCEKVIDLLKVVLLARNVVL